MGYDGNPNSSDLSIVTVVLQYSVFATLDDAVVLTLECTSPFSELNTNCSRYFSCHFCGLVECFHQARDVQFPLALFIGVSVDFVFAMRCGGSVPI